MDRIFRSKRAKKDNVDKEPLNLEALSKSYGIAPNMLAKLALHRKLIDETDEESDGKIRAYYIREYRKIIQDCQIEHTKKARIKQILLNSDTRECILHEYSHKHGIEELERFKNKIESSLEGGETVQSSRRDNNSCRECGDSIPIHKATPQKKEENIRGDNLESLESDISFVDKYKEIYRKYKKEMTVINTKWQGISREHERKKREIENDYKLTREECYNNLRSCQERIVSLIKANRKSLESLEKSVINIAMEGLSENAGEIDGKSKTNIRREYKETVDLIQGSISDMNYDISKIGRIIDYSKDQVDIARQKLREEKAEYNSKLQSKYYHPYKQAYNQFHDSAKTISKEIANTNIERIAHIIDNCRDNLISRSSLERAIKGDFTLEELNKWDFNHSPSRIQCWEGLCYVPYSVASKRNIYFIGDLHGDYITLRESLKVSNFFDSEDSVLIFLGDYGDRGIDTLKVFMSVIWLKAKYPDRVILLRGNHEELRYERDTEEFGSSVAGCYEYIDSIGVILSCAMEQGLNWKREKTILSCIDIMENMPNIVLFPDGLMVLHGFVLPLFEKGNPSEVQRRKYKVEGLDDLRSGNEALMKAMRWARYKGKRKGGHYWPNRYKDDIDVESWENFKQKTGVSRMLRGHDPVDGYRVYPACSDIATMCSSRYIDGVHPTIARYNIGENAEPMKLSDV